MSVGPALQRNRKGASSIPTKRPPQVAGRRQNAENTYSGYKYKNNPSASKKVTRAQHLTRQPAPRIKKQSVREQWFQNHNK